MPGELVPVTGVADFMRASKAKNTQDAYSSDLKHFQRWCRANCTTSLLAEPGCTANCLPASPETVATYFAALAGTLKFSTISRRASALAYAHRSIGAYNPLDHQGVKDTLAGIARTLGRAPVKKTALTAELLARAVRKIAVVRRSPGRADGGASNGTAKSDHGCEGCEGRTPDSTSATKATKAAGNSANSANSATKSPDSDLPNLAGLRDRALLLLGFAAALRRSELVALEVADITRHARGALLIIRRSKTDQRGEGLTKAVPHGKRLRAIEALDTWISAAGITEGPIFRGVHGTVVLTSRLTAGQVARIIKKRAAAIGLDPASFSGHSLRSGFITSAAEHGASLTKIADQAGHAKLDTTRGYMQVADAFRDHSGRKFL